MAKKKSFLNTSGAAEGMNPALAFISKESIDAVEREKTTPPTGTGAPEGYKLNPAYIEKYIEKKTKRVQLVLQPSLYKRVKAASEAAGLSFNEFCHRVLDKATKEESED